MNLEVPKVVTDEVGKDFLLGELDKKNILEKINTALEGIKAGQE